MQSLYGLLEIQNSFNLLIAPPGWGKTRLLLELYGNKFNKIIFISPLRALAEEFSSAIDKGLLFVSKASEREDNYKKFLEKSLCCLVTTPELIDGSFYDLIEEEKNALVVMDEFHLFYYWGTTFRPILFESFMGVVSSAVHVLALSATFGSDMIQKFSKDVLECSLQFSIVDLGNQRLKNIPQKNYYYPNLGLWRKCLRFRFITSVNKKKGTVLYFCQYRSEVDYWVNYFQNKNISVLGCKGGEVGEFVNRLDYNNPPNCIVSTSTLSHGVNLPEISEIFIGYKMDNKDFWIQMVGRGGRRGEKFVAHTMDSFNINIITKIKSQFITLLFNIHLAIYYSLIL